VGDVGDRHFEEIDRIEPGKNYGWGVWEGAGCVVPGSCTHEGFELPFAEHPHNEFCSITGGTVYRGRALPDLYGKYVYANYCTGTVWALDREGQHAGRREVIAYAGGSVGSFAEGRDGELYLVHTNDDDIDGRDPRDGFQIRKLVPNASRAPAPDFVQTLAGTGCVHRRGFRTPPRGMVSYQINHPPWEDGATVHRFVTRRASVAVPGDPLPLFAPEGSVFIKTYELGGRPIESQVLRRRADGGWDALDYAWNDEGTDAEPVLRARTKRLPDNATWNFAGNDGCVVCHNQSSETLLGFRLSQLTRGHGNQKGSEQLARLERRGVIRWRKGDAPLPRIVAPTDGTATVDARARAYLQVNCSHCHRPGGHAGEVRMDLRTEIALSEMNICGRAPTSAWPGADDAMLLAPGRPERSLLSRRMHLAGSGAMPPQRHVVDRVGAELIDAWIRSLGACG
jgi:mono/diheme cytochrome c family protein